MIESVKPTDEKETSDQWVEEKEVDGVGHG